MEEVRVQSRTEAPQGSHHSEKGAPAAGFDSTPTASDAGQKLRGLVVRGKTVASSLLVYITNHVVTHIPSHTLRRAWYRAMGVSIGPNSAIQLGCHLLFYGPGHVRRNGIRIGAHTIINRDCVLDCRGPLTIGDNVSVSAEVMILTSQHRWQEPDFEDEYLPVTIDDYAWIGTRATILPGTRIGRGAVVSAGSVRSGDTPELAVVAGVPGRVIGKRPEKALEYEQQDLRSLFE